MKNILKIFNSDIKGLWKNKLALLIAVAICVLPSLYAWFNIYSNWDPYSNTSTIPVAVVSVDEGYEKEDGETVVMGNDVIDSLKENDKIGWQFVETKQDAIDGVYSGDYYAAIVIGENFSESMYGFADHDLVHPSVTYYENEKKNPIASKITDTAKETLQSSINEEFVSVAVSTVMESLNELADDAQKTQYIQKIIGKLETVDKNLSDYLVTLDSLITCNTTLASNLKTAGSQVTGVSGKIENGAAQVGRAREDAKQSITVLQSQMDAVYETIHTHLQEVNNVLVQNAPTQEEISNAVHHVINTDEQIEKLKEILQSDLIPDGTNKDNMIELLDSIQTTTDAVHNALANGIGDHATLQAASKLINAVMPVVEKQLQQDIDSMKANIAAAYNHMAASLKSMNEGLTGTGTALNSLSDTVSSSNGSFSTLKDVILASKADIQTLLAELKEVDEGERYEQFIRILSTDPETMGAFFSEPVVIDTVAVYPVENYGSGVTPFYTILALWVGAVILVALFKVQVEDTRCVGARLYEKYFGRFLLFFVLGQLQALIVVLGDLYLLKVQCKEPTLFFVTAAFTSFTFTLLIYTLTVSFGDVGKAFVVVVMVIQIAGSSGTYPIEILPEFYRNVYQYFPFPYAMNAMRETIGGMYESDYWTYMGKLSVFALAALMIGLFVRKPFMKINHFVEERMEDTKMM